MLFGKKKTSQPNTKVNKKSTVLSDNSPWSIQEAYKVLRTNILFSLPGEGHKTIAVTSAFASDGKTTNAVNTAIAMGKLGKKVLLIDCDMRKPSIDSMLGIQPTPGLSDTLAGMKKLENVVQHERNGVLDVIAAGNIPPDPTLLLQGKEMHKLLETVGEMYDYVILDFPPVTTVTDAVLLADMVNGYLIVVRHGKTDYRAVIDTVEQLRFAKANIIGFIYNDYSLDNKKYSYGRYGYGKYRSKGYGYGYGYKSGPDSGSVKERGEQRDGDH